MVEVVEPSLRYVPMSWQEFVELPEDSHAEWVDGVAVMAPNAVDGHNQCQRRLANLIEASIAALHVSTDVSVRLPRNRVRRPDISAYAEPMSGDDWLMPATPVLVAEVLSPSTRREDLIRKTPEYLEAGIAQCWIVDRSARVIEVLGNAGDHWQTLAVVDDDRPVAEVSVGAHGVVHLDLHAVVGDGPRQA